MKKKLYLICPVRNANPGQKLELDAVVAYLEGEGYEVHYPPRDVDQSNDDGGVRICYEHREAMRDCDVVGIMWDDASKGSHFDLGMAYMLSCFKDVEFISPKPISKASDKSFQNVAFHLVGISYAVQAEDQAEGKRAGRVVDLDKDSGDRFLSVLDAIAREDAAGLKKAAESYGPSWKSRGGLGAFMMLARKWDRMEQRLKKLGSRTYDIFHGIATDSRGEGLIDDVRDLRRYLMLVEAEMRARGFGRQHRDNAPEKLRKPILGCTCKVSPARAGHEPGCPRGPYRPQDDPR